MYRFSNRKYFLKGLIIGLLTALVFLVYWQARHYEFLSFDDGLYVYENPHVKDGLNRSSVAWSFSFDEKEKTYWHPLTWLSHMLDVELFGLDAGWHHLTNITLHWINALLLFFLLVQMTGSCWKSALVAALFAVHPVNVESIAWVAERKNVLSTAFWLLTTSLYVYYTRNANMRRYSMLLFVFTIGLLAKPMLVTLPCTFFLLDFWPLGRFKGGWACLRKDASQTTSTEPYRGVRFQDLIFEKIPLIVLSSLIIYLAMGSLRNADVTVSYQVIPLSVRIQNAVVSYVIYMSKAVWPSDLAMFYPFSLSIPIWKVSIALMVLCLSSAVAILMIKKRPYLIVGWFWFLGTLVPVSGIVQAGLWPAWANRWAYVPYIGLFIIVVWGMHDIVNSRGVKVKAAAVAVAAAVVGAFAYVGHQQAATWENDVELYQNAISVVSENYVAHNNLGAALYQRQRVEEALVHVHESIRINPFFPYPYFNLGRYYLERNQFEEAENNLLKCLSIEPKFSIAHTLLGETKQKSGDIEKAFYHYQEALKHNQIDKRVHNNIGVLYLQIGQLQEAIKSFHYALRIDQSFAEAQNNIGFAYLRAGQAEMARDHLEKALKLDPGNGLAQENLQEALLACRN